MKPALQSAAPSTETQTWITCPMPNAHARVRLFCFPYAGGGAAIYRTWPHDVPGDIEVNIVKLPGRETRLREPPLTHITPLVEALGEAMHAYLDKPFALFGHSMGALISFELARHLRRQYQRLPVHLFVSGFRAPDLLDPDAPIHALPEAEFIEAIRDFDGTPDAVMANAELMHLMLPALRADFAITETYAYCDEPPFNCPISAFGGLQDKVVSREMIAAWSRQTCGAFKSHMLPGNHFFLHSARSMLLWSLAQELVQSLHMHETSATNHV